MNRKKLSTAHVVLIIEVVLAVMFGAGVGLVVGAFSATAGVGAALIAWAVIGLAFVMAWERGHAQ